MQQSPAGPTWVGIGAQRSGTTWFTRMLASHPMVTLPQGGRKELHWFNQFTLASFDDDDGRSYRELFGPVNGGEFTPAYMRQPWIAPLLGRACPRPPLIIALLRDPLDRFASSMRWQMSREGGWRDQSPLDQGQLGLRWAEQAMLGSMYGPQLAAWRDVFDAEGMMVVQFEHLQADPVGVVQRCWQRLGLGPVPLTSIKRPSRTTTNHDLWSLTNPIRDAVVAHVAEAVDQAVTEWSLDLSLWQSWTTASSRT